MELLQKRLFASQVSASNTSLLPPEYQQVEYIEVTGPAGPTANTHYILTSYIADSDTEVIVKACSTKINAATNIAYGSKWGLGVRANNNYSYRFGSTTGIDSGIIQSDFENLHTISLSKNGFFVDGVRANVDIPQDDWVDTVPISVFALRTGNLYYAQDGMRIKEFICRKAGKNLLHLISCYRKSGDVIGLYDLCGSIDPLTGTPLHINAGTGTFLKGDDI